MGRQVQFHMLAGDLKAFLDFVQNRDPVTILLRCSHSAQIESVPNPSSEARTMALWNQAILSSLKREHIVYPGREYYGIDASLPTLELSPSQPCEWNGRAALLQGRLYGLFDKPLSAYEKWYDALARWIRKHFARVPIPLPSGYIGPSAYEWFRKGGVLLPMFLPPLTSQWRSWLEAQDQHRIIFTK